MNTVTQHSAYFSKNHGSAPVDAFSKLNICLQTGEGGGEGLSLGDGKLLLSTTFADNFLSTPGRNSNIPNFTSGFRYSCRF